MSNYKLRVASLLNAISDNSAIEKSMQTNEPTNLWTVGAWSLTHQNVLETFSKSNRMNLSQISNCSEMLALFHEFVHIAYAPGVLACQIDNDLEGGLNLLKFFNNTHTDGVLKLVFIGSSLDAASALYLAEQSTGYKHLEASNTEGLSGFLQQALQASQKHRATLLERLISIAKLSSLTPREMAVMIQVLNGITNKEIAQDMGNSCRTIEIHRASIFEKMDVKNAIELSMLLHRAIRN
jgi:DNA-binding NarL/FixJ family response regulator